MDIRLGQKAVRVVRVSNRLYTHRHRKPNVPSLTTTPKHHTVDPLYLDSSWHLLASVHTSQLQNSCAGKCHLLALILGLLRTAQTQAASR